MTKNTILAIAVILIGSAIWFFVNKYNGQENKPMPSPSLSPSPSMTPLPTSQQTPGPIMNYPGGLKIQDLVIGTGDEAVNGKMLSVHYTGTLENGTKFDSSVDRGEPFSFLLGSGQVIQGWEQGFKGMKVGGKRKIIIPPNLGYGSRGAGGVIPPNATLIFEVELLAVK